METEGIKLICKVIDIIPGALRKKAIEQLVRKDNMYWKKDGDGPFCMACTWNNNKMIRMRAEDDWYRCNKCGDIKETKVQKIENDELMKGIDPDDDSFY